ncbi:MAG: lamin tail domain-containing protein [archaeon]|nr:lamin tail domain-containing protein [archaeon]
MGGGKSIIYGLIIFFLLFSTFADLEITEIMADPSGDDAAIKPLGEWIEIYNNGPKTVSLQGLVFYDDENDHELYITETTTQSLDLCNGCYATIYRNGDSDFNLVKTIEEVRLAVGYPFNASSLIDEVKFSDADEGVSFSKINGEWFKTVPTPGKENVYTGFCDWKLSIEKNNSLFNKETVSAKFTIKTERILGPAQEITVRGTIEDFNGDIITEYKPWTNQSIANKRTKEYSPSLQEGIYQLHFWIENLSCEDDAITNNDITTLIAINPRYKVNDSWITIDNIYLGNDKTAEWGDQFTAKVSVYKGDETQQSVQVWVEKGGEKISKTTKLSIEEKYQEYPLTIPLQLIPNCNQKIDDGPATLIVEAFGIREEKGIEVEDVDSEVCKNYLSELNKIRKEFETETAIPEFSFGDFSSSASSGDVITIPVIFSDETSHDYEAWSYLYKGNKCYSCSDSQKEREDNLQKIMIDGKNSEVIEFFLPLDTEMDEGEYNIKVKIQKDDQKTLKELTGKIYVKNEKNNQSISLESTAEKGDISHSNLISSREGKGILVYQGTSKKAWILAPYIMAITFGLLVVVLVFKKS